MRENGVQAFTYFSCRVQEKEAKNIGLFSSKAFGIKKPLSFKKLTQYSNQSTVEFIFDNTDDKYIFKKEDFMVENHFPFPSE